MAQCFAVPRNVLFWPEITCHSWNLLEPLFQFRGNSLNGKCFGFNVVLLLVSDISPASCITSFGIATVSG